MIMNKPLKTVCEQLDINFSSAKNVIQIYKKEGRLEKKIQREKRSKKHGSKNDLPREDGKDNKPKKLSRKSENR